jgi:hypothetical protein
MSTDSLIVTSATGVDVELAIAGPGSRAYAFIIDWHIRLLLAVSWFASTSFLITRLINNQTKSPVATVLIMTLPATLIYFLYHPILELVMRGRAHRQPSRRNALEPRGADPQCDASHRLPALPLWRRTVHHHAQCAATALR